MAAWFEELSEFLRIQSISAEAEHGGDVQQAGEWVCELIRGAGGECELIDWHGQPLAIGELRASSDAARWCATRPGSQSPRGFYATARGLRPDRARAQRHREADNHRPAKPSSSPCAAGPRLPHTEIRMSAAPSAKKPQIPCPPCKAQ